MMAGVVVPHVSKHRHKDNKIEHSLKKGGTMSLPAVKQRSKHQTLDRTRSTRNISGYHRTAGHRPRILERVLKKATLDYG